jgi:rod shape-determining protein MreD
MIKPVFWTVAFCILAGIMQSTLLARVAVYKAVPDLALCIVVYSAYVNGAMAGQISGFISGLMLDLLSAAPLGLNCMIRLLIGAFTGLFKGAFFLDAFFLPVVFCATATFFKAAIFFLLRMALGSAIPVYSFITPLFWAELCLNSLLAPLVFGLLKRIKHLSPERNEN